LYDCFFFSAPQLKRDPLGSMNPRDRTIPLGSDLGQFLCGCYHQDWDVDASTSDGIVERFKKNNPPRLVATTAEELERFLTKDLEDAQLEQVLFKELSVGYDPRPQQTPRAWLGRVLQLLRADVHAA
jgi:hypothetical protein